MLSIQTNNDGLILKSITQGNLCCFLMQKQIRNSSIQKMLVDEAPDDRKITKFPRYLSDSTPYNNVDFSEKTKVICRNRVLTETNFLRLSKIIILGDLAVGKTAIVNRFCRRFFNTNYKATIGVDFEVERFDIHCIPYNLQIWDTAGQERFKSIAQSYYRGAHVIVIVFDLTNHLSLINAKVWLHESLEVCGSTSPYIFLVGSKKDLLSKQALRNMKESGRRIAKKLNAEFWTVSSKTGHNISEMFYRIAALTFDDCICKHAERSEHIQIGTNGIVSYKSNIKLKNEKKSSTSCGKCLK